MASAFGHAVAAIAFGQAFSKKIYSAKFWLIGIFCSIIPDADVISFKFNIPYSSIWGHRGFTHSLLFALVLGFVMTLLFYRKELFSKNGWLLGLYFSICTASHGLLDGMTTGGMGVAFFAPWDNDRYFLPFRPIRVSPLGISNFFSKWGMKVIESEAIWIGIPALIFVVIVLSIKRFR